MPCDKCGTMMVFKLGKYGKFLACPKYPECKNTKPIIETINTKCPKCSGAVRKLKTKKGKVFFGCENYPTCDFISWDMPTDKTCSICGKFMVEKFFRKSKRIVCSDPNCNKTKTKDTAKETVKETAKETKANDDILNS